MVTLTEPMYLFTEDVNSPIICVRYVGTFLDRTINIFFNLFAGPSDTATGTVYKCNHNYYACIVGFKASVAM